jgi:hypothetical protein
MYPGTVDPKKAAGGFDAGGVASLLSLAQGQGAGGNPLPPSQHQPPLPHHMVAYGAAAAALAGRPRAHSGSSVLSAASSHASAATAAGAADPGAAAYPFPPPPPGAGPYFPPPPHMYHHPHATGAGYPHHAPMHPHHPRLHPYGPPVLKAPLPGAYARASLPTYVPSVAAAVGAGGGGGTHQGVWSSELRAEYRGWLQVRSFGVVWVGGEGMGSIK